MERLAEPPHQFPCLVSIISFDNLVDEVLDSVF